MSGHRYRSIPLHLRDSDAFRELSLEAKGLLLTLALQSPYTGLARFAPGVLAIHANATPERFDSTIRELEAAGWIVTDGNAIFIVDLLGWQPNHQPTNKNHRPNVEESIASIGSEKLIEAFWARYPEWRADLSASTAVSSMRMASGRSRNAIVDTIPMLPDRDNASLDVASDRQADQVQVLGKDEGTKNNADRGGLGSTSATASVDAAVFARAVATVVEREQTALPGGSGKSVRADDRAAAELQAAGVPLSFAVAVAAEIASTFKPTADSPRIVSSRYVNSVVLERWRLANLSPSARSGSTGPLSSRRSFRDDSRAEQDVAINKDPRVNAAVKAHIAKLNDMSPGSGDSWLEEMRVLARARDRYVYPFAFEWLRSQTAIATSAGGVENSDATH